MTRSRTWTVDTSLTTPVTPVDPAFTLSTPTTHPVGAADVVYAETTHPTDRVLPVTWRLDGAPLDPGVNDRAVDLEPLGLTGTHTLTATVGAETRTWTVDARRPSVTGELSEPLLLRMVGGARCLVHRHGRRNTPNHGQHFACGDTLSIRLPVGERDTRAGGGNGRKSSGGEDPGTARIPGVGQDQNAVTMVQLQ